MAKGFKTGGRKPGAKNKRTLLLESAAREIIENASKIIGAEAFEGDAHAFLILIYKNPGLPLDLRVDAAKAAIRFEKPALTAVDARGTFEAIHYAMSDEPPSEAEWTAQHATEH